ncbi:hypothetical protein AB0929_29345 [Streptomyces massasporeus]|uniref:hypothetical protein n=1 Tax=Streptomyces massasporeus TaxID=67324 RepID=UPI0033DA015E
MSLRTILIKRPKSTTGVARPVSGREAGRTSGAVSAKPSRGKASAHVARPVGGC